MGRTRTAWLALGLVVVSGVLAVLAGAAGGAWTINDRGGLWEPGSAAPVPTPRQQGSLAPPPTPPPVRSGEPPAWLTWAAIIVVALLVAIGLVWLWRWLTAYVRARQEAGQVESAPTGEIYPDAPVIRAGLTSALDELTVTANPTDAVLRAWVALEGAAARSGVPRRGSDTPTEFTARVLNATGVDRDSVEELLHLYHQARFSWHGLTSADLDRARACLEGLTASWSAFEPSLRTEDDPGSPTARGGPGGRGGPGDRGGPGGRSGPGDRGGPGDPRGPRRRR